MFEDCLSGGTNPNGQAGIRHDNVNRLPKSRAARLRLFPCQIYHAWYRQRDANAVVSAAGDAVKRVW